MATARPAAGRARPCGLTVIRHRSTRADAAAHYRESAEHHVPEQAATEAERLLADGTDAVVLGGIRQTARSPERPRHRAAVTPRSGAAGSRPGSGPRARRISSTLCLASPKSMPLFSRKNSGFCTPA